VKSKLNIPILIFAMVCLGLLAASRVASWAVQQRDERNRVAADRVLTANALNLLRAKDPGLYTAAASSPHPELDPYVQAAKHMICDSPRGDNKTCLDGKIFDFKTGDQKAGFIALDRLARGGDLKARYYLANVICRGKSSYDPENEVYLDWLRAAAAKDDLRAAMTLRDLFLSFGPCVDDDEATTAAHTAESDRWFRQAAALGVNLNATADDAPIR